MGATVWDRGEIVEAECEAAGLRQSKWNESHADNPCHSHTYPSQRCQRCRSLRRHSSWELECGDCRGIQGEVCCGWWGDGPRGHAEGDCGGKCLWRKARPPWRQGDTAESVGWGHPFSSHRPAPAAEQQRGWPVEPLTALNKRRTQSGGPLKAWMGGAMQD